MPTSSAKGNGNSPRFSCKAIQLSSLLRRLTSTNKIASAKPIAQLSINMKGVNTARVDCVDISAGPITVKQMNMANKVSPALSRLQGGSDASGAPSFAISDISRRSFVVSFMRVTRQPRMTPS